MKLPRSETWDFGPEKDYRVFVAWPESVRRDDDTIAGSSRSASTQDSGDSTSRPVLYVLDANAKFATIVELIRMRSHRPGVKLIEEPIVVGIGYPIEQPYDRVRRSLDLTFGAAIGHNPAKSGHAPAPTGGAVQFLEFLTHDVIPKVSTQFAVDKARSVLLGHSLAGNFVLNVMRRAPGLFASHIAISPSVWWNYQELLTNPLDSNGLVLPRSGQPLLQVAVGEYEEQLSPSETFLANAADIAARRGTRRMVSDSRALVAAIQKEVGVENLALHHLFPGEDHLSVIHPALNRTINIAFQSSLRSYT